MSLKKTLLFFAIALGIFIADYALKSYVHENISPLRTTQRYPYGGIAVFRDWHGIEFSIVHVMNRGAAWGAFASWQGLLLYARIGIVIGLFFYLVLSRASSFTKFCLTLITAGALCNIVDYFIYGHVVDMFYFRFSGYSYPVFNIADSAIFIGVVLLVLESFFGKKKAR
ncbi:MAG: signal peptidase II [Verrucomicrobia bacterium]|nr:signal peptidase II [Verrucomicrobiota bacterium]